MSERPHRVRTWAPKGKTPILQYSFTWNQLSAVAGVTFWNIYFKLVKGAVRAPEIVAFLKNLKRHLAGRKLLIIWDRLQAHRSRLVRDYVETEGGDIKLEFLPPYAPELNPVEYLWAHWKQHEMPNFCPKDFAELSAFARAKLKRTQRPKLSSTNRSDRWHGCFFPTYGPYEFNPIRDPWPKEPCGTNQNKPNGNKI